MSEYDEELDRVGRQGKWFFILLLLTMPLWYPMAVLSEKHRQFRS